MLNATETANRLIKQHGDAAPEIAAHHAADSERVGDGKERQHWVNVVVEAKALLARDQNN
jgi:hypothetical protein